MKTIGRLHVWLPQPVLGSVLGLVCFQSMGLPATYDLSSDFSLNDNPDGAWSYGHLGQLGGTFGLLRFPVTLSAENGVPIQSWLAGRTSQPIVAANTSSTTAVFLGGEGFFPPGTVWCDPGEDGSPLNYGTIRFRVPAGGAGTYKLETAVRAKSDGPTSGDADFHVSRNGVELFGQFLPPRSSTSYSNLLDLVDGDTIDFAIGRGTDGQEYGSGLKIAATLTQVSTNLVPPTIVTQPASQAVTVGDQASFTVSTAGTAPLNYQWRFNDMDIPDATNVTLTLSSVQFSHAGGYAVVVTNAFGSVTSVVAQLTVTPTPPAVIVRGPYLQSATPGSITLRRRTDLPTDSRVRYGTSADNLAEMAADPAPTTEHVVTLTGLAPDTKYFYALEAGTYKLAAGADYFFTTPPLGRKPARIWAIGDAGTASFGSTAPLAVRDAYLNFTGSPMSG